MTDPSGPPQEPAPSPMPSPMPPPGHDTTTVPLTPPTGSAIGPSAAPATVWPESPGQFDRQFADTHRPPGRWLGAAILVQIVAVELATSRGAPGLGLTLGGLTAVAGTALAAPPRTAAAKGLLAAGALFSLPLVLRDSGWLAVMNVLTVMFCLLGAATLAYAGAWWRQTAAALVGHSLQLVADAVVAPFVAIPHLAAWSPERGSESAPEAESGDGPSAGSAAGSGSGSAPGSTSGSAPGSGSSSAAGSAPASGSRSGSGPSTTSGPHGAAGETSTGSRPHRLRTVLGGAAVAIPLVLVLVMLLSSADAAFADLVDLDISLDRLPRHIMLALLGYGIATILSRRSSMIEPVSEPAPGHGQAIAGNVILASTGALFGLFAASRLISQSTLAEQIANTDGASWSTEARAGFFQLLAVAAIMAVVLLSVRSWSRVGTPRQRLTTTALATANVVFLLGIVADAYLRLRSYEDAYGWTWLRLACVFTALWLGAAFVMIAAGFFGTLRSRAWLTPALLTLTGSTLLLVTAVNPEAIIAHRNLQTPTENGVIDTGYLASLSADAIPTIVENSDGLDGTTVAGLYLVLCDRDLESDGIAFNAARARAATALDDWCRDQ